MATEKDYYGVGNLRGQRHIPSKNKAKYPPVEDPVNVREGIPYQRI